MLEAASAWKQGTVVDVEGYYRERADEVRDIFADDLVVIDPADKGRNLAASVARKRLWEFVSAAREVLQQPSPRFFFPEPRRVPASREVARSAESRNLVALRVGRIDAVVDILWSQLYRTQNALSNRLGEYGFEVIRSASWSNENNLSMILFEVATDPLGRVYTHYGPEIFRKTESAQFLKTRRASADTAGGPWINGNRWVMARVRKKRRAIDVVREVVKSPRSQQLGVARRIAEAAKHTGRVYALPQLVALARRDKAFAGFLSDFIAGRPRWLKD
jgi:tRNA nucleotidyltransferase (CCA-adding enzyme)